MHASPFILSGCDAFAFYINPNKKGINKSRREFYGI